MPGAAPLLAVAALAVVLEDRLAGGLVADRAAGASAPMDACHQAAAFGFAKMSMPVPVSR